MDSAARADVDATVYDGCLATCAAACLEECRHKLEAEEIRRSLAARSLEHATTLGRQVH
eukprot:CAMPEP_0183362542 /NCGR_PEP_ID=MMETSP0164_2-20130417/70019_1 /TAXON_ID=221442 /ORGANISM="Coccolithus pelagicus ssp braarudi, Strain PLY182g" /LENGTH=58 /DNA_ID=CAMNT_0025537431 /DNA_START=33 /DNA_END=209 /DNA_ORIENTATION=+